MLHDQQDQQLATMVANSKANMDVMMECMNVLIPARGGGNNKETSSPPNSGTNTAPKHKWAQKPKHMCLNCKKMVIHKPELCYKLEANKSSCYDGWVSSLTPTAWQTLDTNNVVVIETKSNNLVKPVPTSLSSRWTGGQIQHTTTQKRKGICHKIGQQLHNLNNCMMGMKTLNRKAKRTGILDSGATSGAGPKENEEPLLDMGLLSEKTFMFPDKCTAQAMKKMLLKHNIRESARKIKMIPGMHSTLMSILRIQIYGLNSLCNFKFMGYLVILWSFLKCKFDRT
jgi:hypothetical protein